MKKGQGGLEVILLISALLLGSMLAINWVSASSAAVSKDKAKKSLETLADAVKEVQAQGASAVKMVEIHIPSDVNPNNTYASDGVLNIGLTTGEEIVVPIEGCMVGELPNEPGQHQVYVRGGECAAIGTGKFDVSPKYFYVQLLAGDQSSHSLTIQTSETTPVTLNASQLCMDGSCLNMLDLDPNDGLEYTDALIFPSIQTSKEVNFEVKVPPSTVSGVYEGGITVKTEKDKVVVPVKVTVYTTVIEIITYNSPDMSKPSSEFNVTQGLWYRVLVKRNAGMLFDTDIKVHLEVNDKPGVWVNPSCPYNEMQVHANNGIYEGNFAIIDNLCDGVKDKQPRGEYTLVVTELTSGNSKSVVVNGIEGAPVWKLEFTNLGSQANNYNPTDTSAEIKFKVLDQDGVPIKGLDIQRAGVGDIEIVPMGAPEWKFVEAYNCGEKDKPSKATCASPANWNTISLNDVSWTQLADPSGNQYHSISYAYNWGLEGNWYTCANCMRFFRKHFTVTTDDLKDVQKVKVYFRSDEGSECYINGVKVDNEAGEQLGWLPQLKIFKSSNPSQFNFNTAGDNVLACRVIEQGKSYCADMDTDGKPMAWKCNQNPSYKSNCSTYNNNCGATWFRYFDAGLYLEKQGGGSEGKMILKKIEGTSKPDVTSYLNLIGLSDGTYIASFSPAEISGLPQTKGGTGIYRLELEPKYGGIYVNNRITFNIGQSIANGKDWKISFISPTQSRPALGDVVVKVELKDQKGNKITSHHMTINVKDTVSGGVTAQCDLTSANGSGGDSGRYICTVPQSSLTEGHLYHISAEDIDASYYNLKNEQTFTIPAPEV